jgi:hypothetical protein
VCVGIIALRNSWSFAFTPVAGVQSCVVSNVAAAVAVCCLLVFLVETSTTSPPQLYLLDNLLDLEHKLNGPVRKNPGEVVALIKTMKELEGLGYEVEGG